MTSASARVRLGAAIATTMLVALVTIGTSLAAFSDQTDNSSNDFVAGTVVLTDNDTGVALFDGLTELTPGDSQVGCIEVTYSGSLDPEVRVFGSLDAGTGLEAYLDIDIERGTGTCAAFVADVTVWDAATDGDMGVFLSSATDYTTGVDAWQPTGGTPDDVVPYRITVTQQDDNNAQGLAATMSITWEAQNL